MFRMILTGLLTTTLAASFIDVKENHTFFDAAAYWSEKGVIQGYPDGHFKAYRTVNRAEAVKMVIGSMDLPTKTGPSPFPDVPADAWYLPYLLVAKDKGLIKGYPDGTFRGEQSITFAELAKIASVSAGFSGAAASDPWYKPYLKYLENHAAIPTTVLSLHAPATRGELAEVLFRLKTGNIDRPSMGVAAFEASTAEAMRVAPGGPTHGELLLESFDDGNMDGWSVVDAGEIDIPSMWTVKSMAEIPDGQKANFTTPHLVQYENTYNKDSTIESGREGTYAYWNAPEAKRWTDYRAFVQIQSLDDDGIGILFRYQDAKNYYKLELDSQRNFAKLFLRKNGQETLIAEAKTAYPVNQEMEVRLTARGGGLSASLDGKDLFGTVHDSSLSSGTIGLYTWGSMGVGFDDISVSAF